MRANSDPPWSLTFFALLFLTIDLYRSKFTCMNMKTSRNIHLPYLIRYSSDFHEYLLPNCKWAIWNNVLYRVHMGNFSEAMYPIVGGEKKKSFNYSCLNIDRYQIQAIPNIKGFRVLLKCCTNQALIKSHVLKIDTGTRILGLQNWACVHSYTDNRNTIDRLVSGREGTWTDPKDLTLVAFTLQGYKGAYFLGQGQRTQVQFFFTYSNNLSQWQRTPHSLLTPLAVGH